MTVNKNDLRLDSLFKNNLTWLKDRTIFLTLHGSHAYGTDTPTSDIDLKGIAVAPMAYYLGFNQKFEQAEYKDPYDAVIYEIRKIMHLAADNNPNIIEVLFTDPSDHVIVSKAGQLLIDNRNVFISKKARHTFSGYAISQLKRIQRHYSWIKNPPKMPPTRKDLGLPERTVIPADQLMAANANIRKQLDSWQLDFLEGYPVDQRIAIQNQVVDYLTEIKISMDDNLWIGAARTLGYSDNFIEILDKERRYKAAKDTWNQYLNWQTTRNPARHAIEEKYGYDCKHAYHLVRLMRMAKEILTTGLVIVKRPDRQELLDIRNGAWTYEYLLEWAERQDKEIGEIYATTNVIPNKPNINKLDDLCMEIIQKMAA